MSNYQRNTSLVICIFAVLVIGAVGIGLISYYGSNAMNLSNATTEFSFEADVGATNETVTLDIDVAVGSISITFVDNTSLLYEIEIEVMNTTLATEADPVVTFTSNTIGLTYPACGVDITLGSGVNYTIDVDVTTGAISVVMGIGAHVGDVTLETATGAIDLEMTDDVELLGNATFDLDTTIGAIDLTVDYPTGVGGSIECGANVGDVDITATGWTMITSSHYETSDYATAAQTLTIIAQTGTGSIDATVT